MRLLAIVILGLVLAAPLAAGTFPFKKAQVEISSPEGWKTSEEGGAVTFTAPDSAIAIVFMVVPAKNFEEAAKALDAEAEKAVGEVKWEEKPEAIEINGMPTELWEGTAKDGALEVDAAYINTPTEDVLCLYWFSTAEAAKKYASDIETIVKGIKPLAAGEKKE